MALSMDIREKVMKAIAGGMSRRQAGREFDIGPATAVRWANRLPSARRWSGISRKISSSEACMRQPPIRVVAYKFTHPHLRESQNRHAKSGN